MGRAIGAVDPQDVTQPDATLLLLKRFAGGYSASQGNAPSITHRHLRQPLSQIPRLGRCSWVMLGDAGLDTKVDTNVCPPSGPFDQYNATVKS